MIAEAVEVPGGTMNMSIHVDFGGMGVVSSSLHALTSGSADAAGFDLSGLRSDIVTSAAVAFSSGWSDALDIFSLTSEGLAGGLDATLQDFLDTEQASLDAIAMSIAELDR